MTLSIITINYNNATGLQKTMESVLRQTSKDFEYIIIDGASKDDSLNVIQNYKISNSQIFNYISEPDSGIYNAMNKGIKKAKGNYIQFLNSGDWLVDEFVVENMMTELQAFNLKAKEKNEDIDIFVGKKISVREDGKIRKEQNSHYVGLITFYGSTIQHTSAYINRSLFDKYGLYDETLKIVSDWKWYLIVAGLNKSNVIFTEINVSYFDTTGISSTNFHLESLERRKVLEELVPAPILSDYDKYYLDIIRIERLKKHPIFYRLFWFIERVLFKFEKWNIRFLGWKSTK